METNTNLKQPQVEPFFETFRSNNSEKSTNSPIEIMKNFEYIKPENARLILERVDKLIDYILTSHVDTLVFLDKSARPLAWILRERWKNKQLGNTPTILFSNIGRQEGRKDDFCDAYNAIRDNLNDIKYGRRPSRGRFLPQLLTDKSKWNSDQNGNPIFKHIPLIDQSTAELALSKYKKDLFSKNVIPDGPYIEIPEKYNQKIRKTYKALSFIGKNVLIIDEFCESGTAQVMALNLFSEAFRDVKSIKSTFLFKDQTDQLEMSNIPWLQNATLAGVIDTLEDTDQSFLASPLTQETIDKRRKELNKMLEDEWSQNPNEDKANSRTTMLSAIEDIKTSIPILETINNRFAWQPDLMQDIAKAIECGKSFIKNDTADIGSLPPNQQKLRLEKLTNLALLFIEIYGRIPEEEKSDSNRSSIPLVTLSHAWGWVRGLNHTVLPILDKIIELDTLTIEQAKTAVNQLRKELTAIAKFDEKDINPPRKMD